jgi:hypothetical protein
MVTDEKISKIRHHVSAQEQNAKDSAFYVSIMKSMNFPVVVGMAG